MTTRLKKPSTGRKLAIAITLLAFQGYLGYHLVEGNFGVKSQHRYIEQKAELTVESAALALQIEDATNRNSLLINDKLDPDLLSERARELLGWSNPNDVIIPTRQLSN